MATDESGGRVSRSQAKRAGDVLRRRQREGTLYELLAQDDPTTAQAWWTAGQFRLEHDAALHDTVVRIAEILSANGHALVVVPRLKRLPRIVEKLARKGSALQRLQDIGGCRIVTDTLDETREVARTLIRELGVSHIENAIDTPRSTGYRAIHLIHEAVDEPDSRLIEIQIRTRRQDLWARVVEQTEDLTGHQLKDGDGPPELLEYLRVAAERLALEDADLPADATLEEQIAELRDQVRSHFRQAGKQ